MLTAARIHLPETGTQSAQPDGSKAGWLQVVYKGEVRWARPCYRMGSFTPPNDLWLKKYAEKFAALIDTERVDIHEENEDHLFYVGFTPLEDVLPSDIEDAFPNKSLYFSGCWEAVVSDDPLDPYIELRYTGDPDEQNVPTDPGATVFKLSQKPSDQAIELTQIVDGNPSGSKITFKPDGSYELTVKGGSSYTLQQTKAETQLNGGAALKVEGKDAAATLTVGAGGLHGAVYENLVTFAASLKTWLSTHTHTAPPGGGATTPPVTGPPPDLPTNVKANSLKIPS